MGHYRLECQDSSCNKVYQGNLGYRLICDHEANGQHGHALLKARYDKQEIALKPELPGIFQYADWLPTNQYYFSPETPTLSEAVCYKSHGLADFLGLKNLHIAFSGYWPERGCNVITRSFKEFEVQASIVRYLSAERNENPMPLIVSSAGNTANAYNLAAHQLGIPIYLVVPESALHHLTLPFESNPFVIGVKGDYYDAIDMANQLEARLGFGRDGGVKNVGRRAGMGVPVLNAVLNPDGHDGSLFEHYFQAVGSASGAIAAWEAVELLLADGRFGKTKTKIHMVQNDPFVPIPDAWDTGLRELNLDQETLAKEKIAAVTAQVLTNRKPPYSLAGGIFDVLTESKGMAWRAQNSNIYQAAQTFYQTEKMEISAASAVAICGLQKAIQDGAVKPKDKVLLHITGGGPDIQYSNTDSYQAKPQMILESGDIERALQLMPEVKSIQNAQDSLLAYSSSKELIHTA